MLHLLEFPWWSRVWVVQELVLAKTATLVVGSVTVPWQLISDFCNSYAKHLPPGACCHASATWKMSKTLWDDVVLMRLTFWSFFSAKLERLQSQNSKGAAMAFWEYLWLLRHKESTDPRDKVYGLLGLLHGHCDSILAPDYSLTIAETYSMLSGQQTSGEIRETGLDEMALPWLLSAPRSPCVGKVARSLDQVQDPNRFFCFGIMHLWAIVKAPSLILDH